MKREELTALELTERQVEEVMRLHGQGITQLQERLEEKEAAMADLRREHDALRGTIARHGEPEALARALEEAQGALRDAGEAHAEEMRQRDIRAAVRAALHDAWDIPMAEGLLDREGMTLLPDGRVEGLETQVQALRQERPFLFRTESMTGIRPADGDGEESMLSLEAIAGMTPRQINDNWAAVARALNRNT